ncbi:MAG: hypothetical protein WCR42_10255 [bacterium]
MEEIIKCFNNNSGLFTALFTLVLVSITWWYAHITKRILITSDISNRMKIIIDVIYKQISFEKELINKTKFSCNMFDIKSIFEICNDEELLCDTEINSSIIENEMVFDTNHNEEFSSSLRFILKFNFVTVSNLIFLMNSSLEIIKNLLENSHSLSKDNIKDLCCIYNSNYSSDYILFCNYLLSFLESNSGNEYKQSNESNYKIIIKLLKFHTCSYNYILNPLIREK